VTARALAPAKDDRDVAAVRTGEDRAAVADRVVAASISGGIVNIRRCGMERADLSPLSPARPGVFTG
jgi:hypothetical protein